MEKINWGAVQAQEEGEFAKVKPGGYVFQIKDVVDVPDKQYLKIAYDIQFPNELMDFYFNRLQRAGYDYPVFYRSYKEAARGMFKAFLVAVEKSSSNFSADRFDGDERKLKNLYFGAILREEEYINNQGEIKTRLVVYKTCSADKIMSGDFKVPELKKLDPSKVPNSTIQNFQSNNQPSSFQTGFRGQDVTHGKLPF